MRRPRARERLAMIVVVAAGLACLLALAHRMRLATDISDEGFTIAMPYRFVLGDKPFVDEISIQQTAGFVLYPFIWLYVKVTGGSAGIVLFTRWIHLLVFKGAAALSVYAAARRWLAYRSSAVGVSLVVLAYVPFSIASPSYNVIGMTMLTAGCFLTAAAVAETDPRQRRRLFFQAGVCESLMAVAYPPLAIVALLSAPLVLLLTPSRRVASLGAFIAGGAAAALVVSPAFMFGGVQGIKRSLAWGSHPLTGMSVSAKVMVILESLWKAAPSFTTYALVAVGIAWLVRWRPLVAIVIPGITLAFAIVYRDDSAAVWAGNSTVIFIGLFAPAFLVLARPDSVLWRGGALVVLPSFAGGLVGSYFSLNGTQNAFVGLYAAMALFVVLAARSLERIPADPVFCVLPSFALMFVLVTRYYDYVYRDVPVAQLTETVRTGPFRGLRTTVDRAQMFDELSGIVTKYDQRGGRILFLYEAPSFYLFSKMPPSASCVWEVHHAGQDTLLEYWQRSKKGHGLVVHIKGSPHGVIDAIVAPPEHLLMETPHFAVYADH